MNQVDIEQPKSIALFIDIENFVRSSLEIGLPVQLDVVIKKLLETGRVIVRRAFGDLDGACRGDWTGRRRVRHMMHESLVQFEDIPYVTSSKNTADMRLTVDALSTAFTNPSIDWFAIVSSDRDYQPLIQKLRELGKRIIGIGCSPGTVNPTYIKSCDQFIYYSNLFAGDLDQTRPDSASAAAGVGAASHVSLFEMDRSEVLNEYISLLVEAVSTLERKDAKTVGTAVVQQMRQTRPDFDPSLAGLSSFRRLVDEAERRQILSTERSGMDVLITLTPDSTDGQPPAVDQAAPTVEEPNSILLKRFFESKLRCDWPDRKLRKKIFAELDRVLEEKQDPKESIALVTLAGMIAERLDSDSLTDIQPIVFKVLYSLFRARGFRCFLSEQAYNPLILGPLSDVTDWDELFIRNNLVVLRRERPDWPFEASDIATIFEIREARAQEIIRDTFGTENG